MSAPSPLRPAIKALAAGRQPTPTDLCAAFDGLMAGQADPAEIGGFLIGLSALGETPETLRIGAETLRARMTPIQAPPGAIDTCGTGGDAKGSWNISTAAAIIAAGAGAVVAKHGNKAASSKSGSSDVLTALGVTLRSEPAVLERCLQEAGLAFLFAPHHHAATGRVAPARQALGVRTVFNLLGPLSNPAGAKRQLLGVYDPKWLRPMAEALRALGAERALIVHGGDGMDELTTTTESLVAELRPDGSIKTDQIEPEAAGLPRAAPEALQGGTPQENAAALERLLDGAPGPYRDIAVFNAAAALMLADKAATLADGARLAEAAIDNGGARAALDALIALTAKDAP